MSDNSSPLPHLSASDVSACPGEPTAEYNHCFSNR